MTTYSQKLKDGRWQKKRLEIMQRDGFTCRSCGAKGDDGATLNVHHAYYDKGKNPWDYPDESYVTWCESCHARRHGFMKDVSTVISNMNEFEFLGFKRFIDAGDCCPFFSRYMHCDGVTHEALYDCMMMLESAYDQGLNDGGEDE